VGFELLILVGVVFAAFAIAGFTARTARERGRSAIAWATLAVVAGLVGQVVGAGLFGWSIIGGDDTAISLGKVTFGLLATLFGPLASMLAVLGIVWRLPERVPTLGGARWSLYRLSSPDEPAGACELAVEAGGLRIGDRRIAAGELTELVADGECLRIGWAGGATVLMPTGADRSAKERAKQCQALEKRLKKLLG
jgi:hypothetical protein